MEEEDELLPQTTIGHYEIHRRIGAGGMGDVYAAEHKALGKRVAIKVLRRKFLDEQSVVQRFIREGKLAARLRHPNIVDVTDSAVIDGVPCLVMELLEGEPLVDKIEREDGIPDDELVDLVLPIVAALDHAHAEGVLHRDLKPGNVFLARGWNGEIIPKLLDFGISKSMGESATNALTHDTGFLGTPRYAAPEVIAGGSLKADARSDQYSFGLVLYEASTGRKPFIEAGASLLALARAIASGHTARPRELRPQISEAFERVVRRAMAVLPADRYPSMRELGAALLPLASDRVRTIWEPVFAGVDAMVTTAPTNVTGIESPAVVRAAIAKASSSPSFEVMSLSSDSEPPSKGTLVMTPSATPIASHQGETVAMPRHMLTPRSGAHAVVPPPAYSSARAGLAPMIAAPPAPARFPYAAVLVGAVALFGAAAVSIRIVRSKHPVAPASAAAAPTPVPMPVPMPAVTGATFDVRMRVSPEDAAIEIDGAPAGTGVVARSFPRDGRRHVLKVQAPGHESATMEFDETSPPPLYLTLRDLTLRETAPEPSGAATAPPRPKSGPSTRPPAHPGSRTDNINPWE